MVRPEEASYLSGSRTFSDTSIETIPPVSSETEADIIRARSLLLGELALAHAPVTGLYVACLIQTEDGNYAGHNYEHTDPHVFDHAEEMAVDKMGQISEGTISRVYLGGKGQEKIKRVSPCSECYQNLAQYFSPDTEVVLFQPGTHDRAMIFSYEEHTEAYAPKPYSSITNTDREAMIAEMREKTLLTDKDLEFMADVRLLGLETGIEFYLTGSASGRGGMAHVIQSKEGTSYRDIDIVAITGLDRVDVERLLEKCMKPYFGETERRETMVNIWFINEIRHNTNYFSGERKLVDLVVAHTLRDGMTRMDYLKKNFFHQIA